jgi:uncharacterized membrane protein
MDKKDEKSWMCIDYWALNKITIKKKILFQINDLLNQLKRIKYFSQIDLKSTYYHICVVDEDVEKMVMWIKYHSCGLLMMPFGLRNVSPTFTTFMNFIFHDKLNEFIIVYIDDILIYFKFVEKHVEHLEYVLEK